MRVVQNDKDDRARLRGVIYDVINTHTYTHNKYH